MRLFLSMAAATLAAACAFGGTVEWTNPAGGDWHDGANWSTGVPPGPGDDVVFNVMAEYVVTLSAGVGIGTIAVSGNSDVTIDLNNNDMALAGSGEGLRVDRPLTFEGPGLCTIAGDIVLRDGLSLTGGVAVQAPRVQGDDALMLRLDGAGTALELSGDVDMLNVVGADVRIIGGAALCAATLRLGGSAFGDEIDILVSGNGSELALDGSLRVFGSGEDGLHPGRLTIEDGGHVQSAGGLLGGPDLFDGDAQILVDGEGSSWVSSEPVVCRVVSIELYDGGTVAAPTFTGGSTDGFGYFTLWGSGNVNGDIEFSGPGSVDVALSPPSAQSKAGAAVIEVSNDLRVLPPQPDYLFDPVVTLDVFGTEGGPVSDTITVGGAATLASELRVRFHGGYAPTVCDAFTLLHAEGGVAGAFDVLDLPEVDGVVCVVAQGPNDIRLRIAAVEDLTRNGAVDGSDLAVLLGAWGTDDEAADIDGSGAVDGKDLGALLSAWGSCP